MTREEKIARACELRADTDLSLKKIGKQLGVSHTAVSEWTEHLRPKCGECGFALQAPADDDLCGFCREEMIVALADPIPARTFALWALLDHGHPAEAVLRALREVRSGAAVEAIAERLAEFRSSATQPRSEETAYA